MSSNNKKVNSIKFSKKGEFKGLKNPKGYCSADYSSVKIVEGVKFVPLKVLIHGDVEDSLATSLLELSIVCLAGCDEQLNDKQLNKVRVQNFMNHIIKVCKLHGMSISHQDDQGGFIIEEYDDRLVEWFTHATDQFRKE